MVQEIQQKSGWQDRLEQTFGRHDFPNGMFYEFDFGLRFELGGEISFANPIRRFLQAHSRANEIAQFVFKPSKELYAVTVCWGNKEGTSSDLSRLGGIFPKFNKNNYDFAIDESSEEVGEDVDYWFLNQITEPEQITELLWLDIASEMMIMPAADGHSTFLVDFDNAVAVNAYDDRGMDVIAMNKQKLAGAYKKFNDWLLDYDRKEMDTMFLSD
ncbi:DUF3885 domain-containing protein [Amylibacter sp. IMCC11727]|uniref:DUF3885 domain-containing protein n=1 Tax=Amylibacter sp. IMCC11727 TaxID=3039851 RepID=UPI00244DFCDE|nr:DUF3885 domain-containing protein [Amylibacter sp. IMCC11727]WGI20374.1 DUF3885 domain-containing protein [Amylibacter sp. IMCC11727]